MHYKPGYSSCAVAGHAVHGRRGVGLAIMVAALGGRRLSPLHPELSGENPSNGLVMAVTAHPRVRGHPSAAVPFHVPEVALSPNLLAYTPKRDSLLCCPEPLLEERIGDMAARIQADDGCIHLRHLHCLIATEPQHS